MSDRYVQIPTYKIVKGLEESGYVPVDAKQDKPTRRDPRYVSHSIVLRHESYLKKKLKAEQVPQIVLLNSHNGRTKMRLFAGFYRFICANGLVVGRDAFRYEVRHVGDALAEVMGFADTMTKDMEEMAGVIEQWQATKLSKVKVMDFAKKAAELRFGEQAKSYKLENVIALRRPEDEGDDLWKVYNRIQENTTMGGIAGETANRRAVLSRPLLSVNTNIHFNSDLWNLAEEYARAA